MMSKMGVQEKVSLLITIWLCLLGSSLFLLGDGVNGRGGRVPSVLMEKAEKVAVEEFEWAGEFCLGFQSGRLIYG